MRVSFLFALLAFPTLLFAQGEPASEPSHSHQLGINTTSLLGRILSNESINDDDMGPMISYWYQPNRLALRVGLAGNYELTTDEPANNTSRNNTDYWVESRLGGHRQVTINERWSVFTGLDLVNRIGKQETKSKSDFETFTTTTDLNKFGGGPVLGLQFHFNPRVCLYSEASLHYYYQSEKFKASSDRGGQFETKQETIKRLVDLQMPLSIYLTIRL